MDGEKVTIRAKSALNATLGAGKIYVNDYVLTAQEVDGGAELTIRRGNDVQTVLIRDGVNGVDGRDGADGAPGRDGTTPRIGANGNWFIGETDTGMQSRGVKGDTGAKGEKGDKGETGAQGVQGAKGDKGDTGAQGVQGATGANGISPTIAVSDIEGGHRLTITDAEGVRTVDILDGVGGSGGESVQPDWNQNDPTAPDYVKNRPFYTSDSVLTLLEPSAEEGGQYLWEGELDPGISYTVVIGNDRYENTPVKTMTFQGMDVTYIGDKTLLTGESDGSGLPFMVMSAAAMQPGVKAGTAFTGVELSLYALDSNPVRIDEKYIPKKPLSVAYDWDIYKDGGYSEKRNFIGRINRDVANGLHVIVYKMDEYGYRINYDVISCPDSNEALLFYDYHFYIIDCYGNDIRYMNISRDNLNNITGYHIAEKLKEQLDINRSKEGKILGVRYGSIGLLDSVEVSSETIANALSVDSLSNGRVLGVVDGVLTWVDPLSWIDNAEEVSY